MDLSVNGATIHCRLEGPQGAPCIMLSHALALDLSMWDGFVDRVSDRFQTLRYDSRGHGLSEAEPGPFSLADMGADAIALMEALGIDKVHFVGLSMGGMVGLGLALTHPDRLLSAAICDARGVATPEYRDSWSQRIAAVRADGIEAIVESSVTRWFTEGFQRTQAGTLDAVRSIVRRTSIDGYCWSADALRDLDYAAKLAAVKVPLLFLTGDHDKGAPPNVVRALHEGAPSSRYAEIPDAGHISVIEQPDAFVKVTIGFIESVGR